MSPEYKWREHDSGRVSQGCIASSLHDLQTVAGRLKMLEWKMRYGQKSKGENAGLEKSGADRRGGKCRRGKCGSIGGWGRKCWSRLAVW